MKQAVKGTVSERRKNQSTTATQSDALLLSSTRGRTRGSRGRKSQRGSKAKQGIAAINMAFVEAQDRVALESATGSHVTTNHSGTRGVYGWLYSVMGTTYKRHVAARRMKQNFIKEMRILNGLRHPCIAQIVGAVLIPGLEPMMVMVSCLCLSSRVDEARDQLSCDILSPFPFACRNT